MSLPKNWIELPLEEVIEVLDAQRIPVNNTDRANRIVGKLQSELFPYYGATGNTGYIDDYIFDEELVLLGEDGVPFFDPLKHKAYIIKGKTWVNNHAHVLKAKKSLTINTFLTYFLNQFDYHGYVNGATRLKLNQGNMKKIPFILPPLNEQKRIAKKLDELLVTVESIKTRLDNAPASIKRFRQSILAASTSGKLTEEWREENGVTKKWKGKKLEEVCKSISDGDHQAPPKASEGIPFLVISNIRNGEIDFDMVTRWVPIEYYNNLKDIRKAQRNDILYTVTGSYGIPVIVNTDKQFCFQRHIAIIKSDKEEIETKYLFFLLSSHQVIEQAHSIATGTAQKTVPLRGLRNFKIVLPSKKEQKEIVSQVESLFTLADTLADTLEAAKKRVDKLTQSILAKAFRGELVEQDPDDESAEKLLERIQAEQGKEKPKKTRRKK